MINSKFSLSGTLYNFTSYNDNNDHHLVLRGSTSVNNYYQIVMKEDSASFGKSIDGEWNPLYEFALKTDLIQYNSYSIYRDNWVDFDSIKSTQICSCAMENNGTSTKTPTGYDGVLVVFGYGSFALQLFMDWNNHIKMRMLWSSRWREWVTLSKT